MFVIMKEGMQYCVGNADVTLQTGQLGCIELQYTMRDALHDRL